MFWIDNHCCLVVPRCNAILMLVDTIYLSESKSHP